MNVQEELKALKDRITEIEEQIKEEQAFPKNGDEYWCLGDWLLPTLLTYEDDYTDRGRKHSGNIYKTKEEAEFAAEKLRVEAELRKFGRPFKEDKDNTGLYYGHESGEIMFTEVKTCQMQGAIYFESEEKAQQAIESAGIDRIKKYIFGVED